MRDKESIYDLIAGVLVMVAYALGVTHYTLSSADAAEQCQDVENVIESMDSTYEMGYLSDTRRGDEVAKWLDAASKIASRPVPKRHDYWGYRFAPPHHVEPRQDVSAVLLIDAYSMSEPVVFFFDADGCLFTWENWRRGQLDLIYQLLG